LVNITSNYLDLLVNITSNYQMVGFDIGCHEAIITLVPLHCSWGHKKYSWHSYNGLMTANVKANHKLSWQRHWQVMIYGKML